MSMIRFDPIEPICFEAQVGPGERIMDDNEQLGTLTLRPLVPTTYDFEDGRGPVLAHRHPNGLGWVADTAMVDESSYIGPLAKVFEFATVRGNISIIWL